jgi:hypothetical protein
LVQFYVNGTPAIRTRNDQQHGRDMLRQLQGIERLIARSSLGQRST